ncbi:MAG: hypothetical protein AAF492_20200, partial [Verrucomicrobiota bacterium]
RRLGGAFMAFGVNVVVCLILVAVVKLGLRLFDIIMSKELYVGLLFGLGGLAGLGGLLRGWSGKSGFSPAQEKVAGILVLVAILSGIYYLYTTMN